jgi:hypothetical protein
MIDEVDPHVNPLGVKGIGEIGTTDKLLVEVRA